MRRSTTSPPLSAILWGVLGVTLLLFDSSGCVLNVRGTATNVEFRCSSTIVSDAGWLEVVASTDPEPCATFGACPRFFTYCEGTWSRAQVRAEWEKVVVEVVGSGTFRDHPGPWCLASTRCFEAASFADEEATRPDCRAASAATAFDACPEGAGCLALSRGSIDFGSVETGTVGPAQLVQVDNVCEEPVDVVVDQRYTCVGGALSCTECDPGSRDCEPEFVISSDCLPGAGEESRTLEGTGSVDLLARRCQIAVAFQPVQRQMREAAKVFSTESGEVYRIHLSGIGLGGQAGFTGPEEVCRDPDWLDGRPCTHPDDNVQLLVENLGPAGNLLVSGYELEEEVGFWVQHVERVDPTTGVAATVELPTSLAVGDQLRLQVRYCTTESSTEGLVDENALLLVNTDDWEHLEPTFTVALRWRAAAGGCP